MYLCVFMCRKAMNLKQNTSWTGDLENIQIFSYADFIPFVLSRLIEQNTVSFFLFCFNF